MARPNLRRTLVSLAAQAVMAQQAPIRKEESMAKRKSPSTPVTRRTLSMMETIKLSDWLRVPGQLDGCETFVEIAEKAAAANVVNPPATAVSIRSLMEALELRPGGGHDAASRTLRKLVDVIQLLVELEATRANNPHQEGFVRDASTRLSEARAMILVMEQRTPGG